MPGPVEHYIGLMSGTSLDGVDGALCAFDPDGRWQGVLAHAWRPFDHGLRQTLASLQHSGPDELHTAALAGNALARLYADVCTDLLQHTRVRPRAIGAHGQTVRHQPGRHDTTGYTLQLLQPALLAELTCVDVVADLRSADVAAGGQGAPLVPPFHAAVFGTTAARAVVNIGGISNITVLRPHQPPTGFDCGPGNALMDHWVQRHTGQPYDDGGRWAAQGSVVPALLERWLAQPYFALPPPKSTGRDLFNPAWLADHLAACTEQPAAVDVQASLCELTALTIAHDVNRHATGAQDLLVCGGGARNAHLMRRLAHHLPACCVRPTDDQGLPALQVEAAAFAWLARMHIHRQPANAVAVTGARRAKVLGALYPAS
jgi:anhydro-N-acetylmuramic acid kinase